MNIFNRGEQMKKIGLVGGLGPASTIEYYKGLISLCQREYGADVYPEIVIDSVDMSRHTKAFNEQDYHLIGEYLIKSLNNLKCAGAEITAITANTEHIVWDRIASRLPLQTISVVDSVIEEIIRLDYKKVLVLATEWTMASGLYDKAIAGAGIVPVLPTKDDQKVIGNLIYPNLENGIVFPADKLKMIDIAERYIISEKVDAVLLGCTEIPLMIKDNDLSTPVINSTEVHIRDIYKKARGKYEYKF